MRKQNEDKATFTVFLVLCAFAVITVAGLYLAATTEWDRTVQAPPAEVQASVAPATDPQAEEPVVQTNQIIIVTGSVSGSFK